MKKHCYILFFTILPFTCLSQFTKPVNSLINTHSQFNEDAARFGIRDAFLNNIHTRSMVFLPAPILASDYYNAIPNDRAAALERVVTYLEVSTDMLYAYSTGHFIYNRDKGFPSLEEYGHFVTFWRKEKNKWKILIDFTVDDSEPSTFAPLYSPDKTYIKRFPVVQTSIESTKNIILQSDILYNRSLNLRAGNSAWEEYYSSQIRYFRNNSSPHIGKSTLLPKLSNLGYAYEYQSSSANVSISRDIGYTYGYGIVGGVKDNKGFEHLVHYFRVWKKEENGIWRIVVDIEKELNPNKR